MLGTSFNEKYQLAMGDYYQDSEGVLTGDLDKVIEILNGEIDGSINVLVDKYDWKFE